MLILLLEIKDHVPYDWTKKKREKFADDYGLYIVEKKMRAVRWTVTADTSCAA